MKKPRILVVEDEAVVALSLKDCLRRLGYDVIRSVATGEDAVQAAERDKPDLVLLDVKLQGELDGIDAARLMRSKRAVPVIYLTAFSDDSTLDRAKLTHPHGFLVKPFTERELKAAVETALYRHDMERKLAESELRYRTVADFTCDWEYWIAPDGSFEYVSPSVERITGYPAQQFLDRPSLMRDIIHPDDREKFLAHMDSSPGPDEDATHAWLEFRIIHRDSTVRWISHQCRGVFNPSGEYLGRRGSNRDVTELKNKEQALSQTVRLRAVADLNSGVAHNFNNLLQIVVGGLQLAMMELDRSDITAARNQLNWVLENTSLAAEMIKRLQKLAGDRTSNGVRKVGPLDLSEVTAQACAMAESFWASIQEDRRKTIQLVCRLEPHCLVRGNEADIFDAVFGLIANSGEASASGQKIFVETTRRDGDAIVTVKDEGSGMPKELLDRLFTPFVTTRREVGRGLGLATIKKILEDHGGRISIDSTPESGTTARLILPLSAEVPTVKPAAPPRPASPDRKLAILLIDDVAELIDTLKRTLERHGHTVYTGLTASDGLKAFEANRVDVVICDLGLPDMTGWEVGKAMVAMCKERGLPKPPFLLLSGWLDQTGDEENIREAQVDAVMEKPITMKRLLEAVSAAAAEREGGPS